MARQPRLDAPGAVHHVMFRGIDGGEIFRDNIDREMFLRRAEQVFDESQATCFAWALIPSHGHLSAMTGARPISHVMRRLLTGYAMDFNRRHDRTGHLFQNRFKSKLVEDEAYLDELIRYIHLNPVRAGLVDGLDALESYPWAGHAALMGRAPSRLIRTDAVLTRFGRTRYLARRVLRTWLEEGLGRGDAAVDEWPSFGYASHREEYNSPGVGFDPRAHTPIAARDAFVEEVLREVETERQRRERIRRAAWTSEDVIDWVCGLVGARKGDIVDGRRGARETKARAVAAYLLVMELGKTRESVARELGVTPSAISRSLDRGRAFCEVERIQLAQEPHKG